MAVARSRRRPRARPPAGEHPVRSLSVDKGITPQTALVRKPCLGRGGYLGGDGALDAGESAFLEPTKHLAARDPLRHPDRARAWPRPHPSRTHWSGSPRPRSRPGSGAGPRRRRGHAPPPARAGRACARASCDPRGEAGLAHVPEDDGGALRTGRQRLGRQPGLASAGHGEPHAGFREAVTSRTLAASAAKSASLRGRLHQEFARAARESAVMRLPERIRPALVSGWEGRNRSECRRRGC